MISDVINGRSMEITKFQSELVFLRAENIPLIGAWKSSSSLINGLLNPLGLSFPTMEISLNKEHLLYI